MIYPQEIVTTEKSMQGIFVGKVLGKAPVRRPSVSLEDNIKIVRYVMRAQSG
jgi:hypothetical protein